MGILDFTDTDYIFVKATDKQSPIRYWPFTCHAMLVYIHPLHGAKQSAVIAFYAT